MKLFKLVVMWEHGLEIEILSLFLEMDLQLGSGWVFCAIYRDMQIWKTEFPFLLIYKRFSTEHCSIEETTENDDYEDDEPLIL